MIARFLSPAQRVTMFDPPSDPATIKRLYKFGPQRSGQGVPAMRSANRIGYAVQLNYSLMPA
ncbi:hypothetical protein HNO88_003923 [Novosphingobium chloroacetimidivorans]|uniref:Uncharacterized protein n=1 Tax=Novosphingobium chloroacetimidivorans TaxID=1428314 RepID=A0A7W7KD06_9SPHN|nr:hypothetical protein [Novosphingobium chloroacetimidivorans]MBB4860579.1 hypothetical protein [Novosphingobium chloroacetimidivorans]